MHLITVACGEGEGRVEDVDVRDGGVQGGELIKRRTSMTPCGFKRGGAVGEYGGLLCKVLFAWW